MAFIFLLDMVAFAFVARMILNATYLDESDKLEFRNPYIGLDELYSSRKVKPSFYKRLTNEPRFATQISAAEPYKIFPIDLHRWLSDFGFVSPSDRRLKVSSTVRPDILAFYLRISSQSPFFSQVNTIAQFHVLDYGMERCALAVRLPKRGEILPHLYSLPETDNAVHLDICELSAKRPLKDGEISWATRPPCVTGTLQVLEARVGWEVELEHFDCKSGSFLAYHISCSGGTTSSCNIDVWSNQNATWGSSFLEHFNSTLTVTRSSGFYINQYQTL